MTGRKMTALSPGLSVYHGHDRAPFKETGEGKVTPS